MTPEEIALRALESLKTAFLEGRDTPWHNSKTKELFEELTREFLKKAKEEEYAKVLPRK